MVKIQTKIDADELGTYMAYTMMVKKGTKKIVTHNWKCVVTKILRHKKSEKRA
tara:strand:+ start:612 stop:770 length:159 start_codon:yes stop_codon:yes gene_type:complete